MIKIRVLWPNDVYEIELREEDRERLIYRDVTEWERVLDRSVAYTLLYDGDILCCGGVCLYRKGFGEAWVLYSRKAEKYPHITIRTMKRVFDGIIKDGNLHRVQATVRCDWDRARQLIEFLGFQREGTLRQYGPDRSNYYMYSRIT